MSNDALGVLREAKFGAEDGFMAFVSVFTRVTDIMQHQELSEHRQHSSEEQEIITISAERFPNLAWLMEQTEPVDYERYFEDGIKITIEGLKVVYG